MLLAPAAILTACSASEGDVANAVGNDVAEAAACQPLDAAAKAALRKLDQDYAAAWKLEGTEAQREALLDLFIEKATIIPGGGGEPLTGRDALAGFWFPPDSPPTVVSRFERSTASVEGTSCLAAITGRSSAAWIVDGEETAYDGNYVILAEKRPSGAWKIRKMTWNSRPQGD